MSLRHRDKQAVGKSSAPQQSAEALCAIGRAQRISADYTAALGSLRAAIALDPELSEAHYNLGLVLEQLHDALGAIASLSDALKLKPTYAAAAQVLASLLSRQGKLEEAEQLHRMLLRQNPENADAIQALAMTLGRKGEIADAVVLHDLAAALHPAADKRIERALLLPPIYASMSELNEWRSRFADSVLRLSEAGVTADTARKQAAYPFFLAYQGEDDRALLQQLSKVYSSPPTPLCRVPSGGRIQVGFISAHFRKHTVGELMSGILANLSKDEFALTVLSVGDHRDDVSAFIRKHAERFLIVPRSLPVARRMIAELGLDVLFYTDIGLDRFTYTLAFSRLAPVQCVTWGHPSTTGLSTVDYFLSSKLFEAEYCERYYTESLVLLDGIPAYFQPPDCSMLRAQKKDHFGLPPACHLYICPQSLFKLRPDFDKLLAGILRLDPLGIVTLNEPHDAYFIRWKSMLTRRFKDTMGDAADRIRFLPRLDEEQYLNLTLTADVQLDPTHFNGGCTSLKALALGIPVVTLPMHMLKSRMTYGMYLKMGMHDCVATDAEDYVTKAVRLGAEPAYRAQIKAKIQERKHVLFEDLNVVRELEQFFRNVTARQVPPGPATRFTS